MKISAATGTRAIDVASHLVELAGAEEEPDFLTQLRLQKLLYYVQGWSLAIRGKPMFDDVIEAWSHGPVVRKVYAAFHDASVGVITRSNFPAGIRSLSEADAKFVRQVWDTYKDYSAVSLRKMTHEERPWLDARKGLRAEEASRAVITHDAMKAYFKSTAG